MSDFVKNYCPVCGKATGKLVGSGHDFEYGTVSTPFDFHLCEPCGHMYLGDLPDKKLLNYIYPLTYYTFNDRSPLYLKGVVYKNKLRMDVSRIAKLTAGRNIKSILDVGCGDCSRLIQLKSSLPGIRCTGLDLAFSEATIERAADAGIRLTKANLEEYEDIERYDLILLSQVLEHLYVPSKALERLEGVMSEHGVIFIETPNWQGALDFSLFKRQYWGGYHFPRHFNIFSPSSLRKLVERAGLQVVSQGFLPSPGFWIISFRNSLGLNSSEYSQSFFELLNFQNIFTVGVFSLLDIIRIKSGRSTSNQYLLARKI